MSSRHVVLEMYDKPDCRFVAAWLNKVAEAQAFWTEMQNNPNCARHMQLLYDDGTPDLSAAALELFGDIEHNLLLMALDLDADDNGLLCREFAFLVQLGFLVHVGQSYRLDIPERMTLETVKQAALQLMSSVGDVGHGIDVIQPERLLVTLSEADAQAARARLFALRGYVVPSGCLN